MSSTRATAHPAVAAYVAAVRDELGDLPADEVAEIAEDVRDHLDHVAAEYGDDVTIDVLIDRLGAPAAYAAELRAAAGLPEPAPEPERVGFPRRLGRFLVAFFGWSAVGLGALAFVDTLFGLSGAPAFFGVPAVVAAVLAAAAAVLLVTRRADPIAELRRVPTAAVLAQVEEWVRGTPWGRPAIELVTSLRPAWWIVRAGALALIAFAVFRSTAFSALVFLLAVVGSVWLGRRTAAGEIGGARLLAVQLANAGLAIGGLATAGVVTAHASWDGVQYVDGGYDYAGPEEEGPRAYDADGLPVTNLFAYGPDGALLENVRLYDQDGRPFDLGWSEECYDGAYEQSFVASNPWGEHVFPRLTVEVSPNGACLPPRLAAPFGEQLPGAQPSGTPAPSPPK